MRRIAISMDPEQLSGFCPIIPVCFSGCIHVETPTWNVLKYWANTNHLQCSGFISFKSALKLDWINLSQLFCLLDDQLSFSTIPFQQFKITKVQVQNYKTTNCEVFHISLSCVHPKKCIPNCCNWVQLSKPSPSETTNTVWTRWTVQRTYNCTW